MTEEQEDYIRNSTVGSFMAFKWLMKTRGWGLKESKEYYDDYLKKFGSMTYNHIFKEIALPEETIKEVIWISPPYEDESD